MATSTRLDRIRQSALDDAEKSEKNLKRFIWFLAFLELTVGVVYIVLAVLGFSEAVLIGVAGVCVYCMIFAGIGGLKLHIDASTARILKAVELLADDDELE